MRAAGWLSACALLIGISSPAPAATNRLADIRARGALNCGVWPHVPGFAIEHDGQYAGFDIDICRAVAAAILGDATKVEFLPVTRVTQFAGRQDIDLAVRRLTWTLAREAGNGMVFGPVTFYDGQGFLVPKNSGISKASQLAGERICVINMEHHPRTVYNYFRDRGHEVPLVLVENDEQAEQAMRGHRCRAYSADVSWLAAARSVFFEGLARYEILPDQISKDPLAPLMRREDTELLQLVRWTIYVIIEAEELGLSSRNVDSLRSGTSQQRAFLSVHPGSHVALGADGWVRAIITGVGNYGEVFNRNLGVGSSIRLDRGLNRLWSQGGLMYAPPLDR
jgi:general L-amino acid transport system substrate-binding protein